MATINRDNLTPALRNYLEKKEREEAKKNESEKTPLMKYMDKAKESGTLLSSADRREDEDMEAFVRRTKIEQKARESERKARDAQYEKAKPGISFDSASDTVKAVAFARNMPQPTAADRLRNRDGVKYTAPQTSVDFTPAAPKNGYQAVANALGRSDLARAKQEEAERKAQSERIAAARPMEQVYGDLDRLKARREAFEKTEAANDIADAINDLNMREQKELLEANRITNKSQSEVDDIRADIQKKYAALRKELENSGEYEELNREKRLLEQELRDSYSRIGSEGDFEQFSRYSTTANSEEHRPIITQSGVFAGTTGYDDWVYEYINKNPEMLMADRNSRLGETDAASAMGYDLSYLQSMTDEEIGIYNYLYAKGGKEKAEEYLDALQSDLYIRQRSDSETRYANFAKEHPVLASAASVASGAAKGAAYAGQVVDYLGDGEIDPNASYNAPVYGTNAVRMAVSDQIQKKWGPVGSFAYQTAMSMGDFLTASGLTAGTPLALLIMGSGAAADTTMSALERGVDSGSALALGAVAGAAEALTEKISMDVLFKGDWNKKAIKYIFKNAFSEGTEEVMSDVINTFADVLIAGDKSEWKQSVAAYMEQGLDDKEAFKKAFLDKMQEIGLDFLGGALSGTVMSGTGVAVNKIGTAAAKSDVKFRQFEKLREGLIEDIDARMQKAADAEDGGVMLPTADALGESAPGGEIVSGLDEPKEIRAKTYDETVLDKKIAEADTASEKSGLRLGVSQDRIETAKVLSERTGRDVVFYSDTSEQGKKIDGYYDPSSGNIMLNKDAASGKALAVVLGHELTHTLEQTQAYAELDEMVFESILREGKNPETERAKIADLYGRAGITLSDEAIDAEIVAKYVEKNLLNNKAAIRELMRTQPSVGRQIRRGLDRIAMRLAGTESLMDMQTLEAAVKIYRDAEKELMKEEFAAAAPAEAVSAGDVMVVEEETGAEAMVQSGDDVNARTAPGTKQTAARETVAEEKESSEAVKRTSDEPLASGWDEYLEEIEARYAAGEMTEDEYDEAYSYVEEARDTGVPFDRASSKVEDIEGKIPVYVRKVKEAVTEKIKADNRQYSIAGEGSEKADKDNLQKAKLMENNGSDSETIRKETGWYRGYDGEWRYEIDDAGFEILIDKNTPNYLTLGELIDHPKLFRAYPQLRDVDVVFQNLGHSYANYNAQFDEINIDRLLKNDPVQLKSSLIHEIQHAIQYIEGFAHGVSPAYWERQLKRGFDSRRDSQKQEAVRLWNEYNNIRQEDSEFAADMDELRSITPNVPRGAVDWNTLEQIEEDPPEWKAYDSLREQLAEKYGEAKVFDYIALMQKISNLELNGGRNARELYYETAGEIEARDTAARVNFNETQRKNIRPDIDRKDVVFADGVKQYSLSEENVDSLYEINTELNNAEANTPTVRLYRGFNRSDNANEKNLSKKKSVYEVLGRTDPSEITELAPLSYYTENEEDARNYANMDANLFEEYRQIGIREYRQNIMDGKNMSGISEREFAEKRAQEMFRVLHGGEPSKGRIEAFDYVPKRVLDLSVLGDVVDYDDIRRVYQTLSDAFNIPAGVVEDVLAINEIIDPDTLKSPVFKLLRNFPGNNFGSRMVELAKEAGYDSIRYLEDGNSHYAIINDSDGGVSGLTSVNTPTDNGDLFPEGYAPVTEEEPKRLSTFLNQNPTDDPDIRYSVSEDESTAFSQKLADYIDTLYIVNASKDINVDFTGGDSESEEFAAVNNLITELQNQSGDKIITGYGHKSLVDAAEKIVEEWENNYDSGNILHRKLDEISKNGAEAPSTADEAPVPPKSLLDVLPTQAMTRLKRVEYAFAESMREMFELSNEDYYVEFLQNVHAVSKDVILNGGNPDAAIGKLFTDFNTATEAAMEAWQYAQFERSAKQFTDQLNAIKRYADSRAKAATPEKARQNYTAEDAEKMFEARRDAQKNLDRAKARALLTEEDKLVIGQIKRGEMSVDQLSPAEYNVEDIRAVAEAEMAFDEADKLISIYKKQIKAGYLGEAEDALSDIADWTDKAQPLAYWRETIDRNFRDIIKDEEKAGEFIRHYIKPIHKAEADRQRMLKDYRGRVKALNLNEKPAEGEKVSESYAVQLLGEAEDNIRILEKMRKPDAVRDGRTLDEWRAVVEIMWAENPSLDRAKIRDGVEAFRVIYDELLKQMNEVLLRNGYAPVRYRSGYFPHFTAGSEDSVLAKFGRIFGIRLEVNPLPTSINGLTQDFKPGKAWFSHALERTGFETAYDAVAGFEQYIGGVSDVIHHTDNIQRLRALTSQIRWLSADEGLRQQVQKIENDEDLSEEQKQSLKAGLFEKGRYRMSNLAVYLDEYTNRLANKKNRIDRGMEQLIGRKAYTVMNNLESRVAANMIGFNIGSALTNIIPLNQAQALIGPKYTLRGMWDALQNLKNNDGLAAQSDFLASRRGSDRLGLTGVEKFSNVAGMPMELVDNIVSEAIVRAAYLKNLELGMSEDAALEDADAVAASLMADRSKGALPLIFDVKNPFVKLLTQFQVEVNNEFSVIFKDIPKAFKEKGLAKLAAVLLQYFLGAKIFNDLYEKALGRRPAFDPLEMVNDAVGGLTGYQLPNVLDIFEPEAWNPGRENPADVITDFGTAALESLPFVGGVLGGGRVPIQSALPDVGNVIDAVADNTWSAKRRINTLATELMKPAAYLVPPAAGGLMKKALGTTAAAIRGGVYGVQDVVQDDGSVVGEDVLKYPFYRGSAGEFALNTARSLMSGTSTTTGGAEWVESGFKGLSRNETQAYELMLDAGEDQHAAWDLLQSMKKAEADKAAGISKNKAAKKILRESGISDEAKAAVYTIMYASDLNKELIANASSEKYAVKSALALMDISDIPAGVNSKTAEICRIIADADLDYRTALSIYEKEVSEKHGDKISSVMAAGMTFDDYLRARSKYAELDNSGGNNLDKTADMMKWIDRNYKKEAHRAVLQDVFDFRSAIMMPASESSVVKNYKAMIESGMSEDRAYEVASAVSALEPLEGKSTVSAAQRARAVLDTVSDDEERASALAAVLKEDYRKYGIAHDLGVGFDVYTSFRETLPSYDADGNSSYSQAEIVNAIESLTGAISPEEMIALLMSGQPIPSGTALTNAQKAVLWQLATGSKSAKNNPYSTSAGNKVIEMLYPKE